MRATYDTQMAVDSVEDLIPRAEIFRSKLIEDFQLLDSINKTTTEVPKYYSSELSGKLFLASYPNRYFY